MRCHFASNVPTYHFLLTGGKNIINEERRRRRRRRTTTTTTTTRARGRTRRMRGRIWRR